MRCWPGLAMMDYMNYPRVHSVLVSLLPLLALFPQACGGAAPTPKDETDLPAVQICIGSTTFQLEIASTEAQRNKGLMFRAVMAKDHGMVFVFENEEERAFWMRNTLIPLQILYMDAKGQIISIKSMKPQDETPVPSDGSILYAIELNDGAATAAGIKVGDKIALPDAVIKAIPKR